MKIFYLAFIRLPTEKAHGVQIMKTCEAFAEAGAEVELVVPSRETHIKEDSFAYYDVKKNFSLVFFTTPDWVRLGPLGFAVSALWFSEVAKWRKGFWKVDVIYSRDAFVLLQYVFLGRKLVYEAHTKPTFISKFVAKRAYKLVVISKGLRDAYIKAGVPGENIVVSHDGVDLQQFAHPQSKEDARARLELPLDRKIAMYIGRFDGWKGVRTLLEASKLLPNDFLVAMIGGEREQVVELSKDYPNVQFLGYHPYAELADNQAAADVLVLPNTGKDKTSVSYTSPLKLFSYMASNRPIVASDLLSIREVVDEKSAVLVPPDDAPALAAGIQHAFSQSDLAKSAYSLVGAYSWKVRASTILAFIQSNV